MPYARLALVAVLPVIASAALYSFSRKTALGRLGKWPQQILYGLVFGVLAIFGTEFGVPVSGAIINARDAAPLSAGLIFGAPAGIIAGLIGGAPTERKGAIRSPSRSVDRTLSCMDGRPGA